MHSFIHDIHDKVQKRLLSLNQLQLRNCGKGRSCSEISQKPDIKKRPPQLSMYLNYHRSILYHTKCLALQIRSFRL